MTESALIGHNIPPGMIQTVDEIATDLSAWMSDHPVIANADEAKEAKVFIDRAKLGIKDMEDERDGKVRPLNEKVKEINESYRAPRAQLAAVVQALSERLARFLKEEEDRRLEALREATRVAEEAERAAREAERLEQEALGAADSGELDVDIKAAVVAADSAFSDYQKAKRQEARAEKETKVKISGGFGRAIGLRVSETLIVVDVFKAIGAVGVTEDISAAVLKAARAYKRLNGTLPPGVASDAERTL